MRVVNPLAKLGEDAACRYLTSHKYRIIERNFHAKGGEIDIIGVDTSEREQVLCFIEVKTRSSTSYGSGFEAITYWKLKALMKTAIYYTILHKNLPKSLRIDAVSVMVAQNHEIREIELLKNITQ